MPLPLQTRLLRVLEEKEVTRVGGHQPVPVDVRVISATHCNLEEDMQQGQFRRDLFYRLRAGGGYSAAGGKLFENVSGGTLCPFFCRITSGIRDLSDSIIALRLAGQYS